MRFFNFDPFMNHGLQDLFSDVGQGGFALAAGGIRSRIVPVKFLIGLHFLVHFRHGYLFPVHDRGG